MNTAAENIEARLIFALQQGVPLEHRPFAKLGTSLGLKEDDVLARLRDLFQRGVARRFGAVFDAQSLGYASTLCAAHFAAGEIAAAAERLAPHPGVTHCYERDGQPNLWFTLTATSAALPAELARVSEALGHHAVLNLPALRRFKIEAVFGRGPRRASHQSHPAVTPCAERFGERERAVVRRMQDTLPLVTDPFDAVARELAFEPVGFLELLRGWHAAGIVRRVGVIVHHRQLGFEANSMCVWNVAGDAIDAAGRTLARSPHVTHCYERAAPAEFPYNLYAMLHASTRAAAVSLCERLSRAAGLPDGRMFWSVREFKKSSPVFFSER
jgi:DNA-binding Lrp family transcriptional regulator